MATLSTPTISCTAATPISSFSFLKKPHPIPTLSRHNHSFKISCKSKDNESPPPQQQNHPRQPQAPILTSDNTKCDNSTDCCPPVNNEIINFTPPQPSSLRVRPAAHLAKGKYMDEFKQAIQLMKELDKSDPRSFEQQAKVHCAYCTGAYEQVGFQDQKLCVHNSWLFFPFHRYYLYFFEKILGKLVGNPNFAMPFWAWDTPKGMTMPAWYAQPDSPLYDVKRDARHQPPVLIDLNYDQTDQNGPCIEQISINLAIMYRQVVSSGKTPKLFMGMPYQAGDHPNPGAGSLEHTPHNNVHDWCGDRTQPKRQDMGLFATSGRDPIFYAHHGNVDRMWSVWKTLGGKRKDFMDPDWLNTEFLFYDEEKRLVKVKVRDCLDERMLGYEYQKIDIPWLNNRPTPRVSKSDRKANKFMARKISEFPIKLDKTVRVKVTRPKKLRSQKEKDEEEEILVINGIELDLESFVKFDVFINDEGESVIRPDDSEFAGSFVNVPHSTKAGTNKTKTCLSLGITELLEDLGAEDEAVVVTFVPRQGTENVTISGAQIEFDS